MTIPQEPNQRWSLDFVSDTLTDSRRFRILADLHLLGDPRVRLFNAADERLARAPTELFEDKVVIRLSTPNAERTLNVLASHVFFELCMTSASFSPVKINPAPPISAAIW
jgi:hypothetical protein